MGKATRWLKGLFGIKTANKDPIPGKIGARFQNADAERERNKHAIAVATATAAAADAAVVAAQAAAAVVRLTSQDRNRYNIKLIVGALTIQTNFRRYLARKALRALKGVVKIQALVRGYLVRRQAAATLHGIEALFRAQATVQSRRASNGINTGPARPDPLSWARPSMCEFGIEQYYNALVPSMRSRRMSASFEARTLDPPNDPLGEDPQVVPSQFQLRFQSHSHFVPCHHNCIRLSSLECGPGADMLQQLYYHYPNNMAKTVSFKAKVRAQSAPKQRPEPNQKRSGVCERKRGMPMREGRNSTSVSGVRTQRSSSHLQEPFNFKNVVMGKIGNLPLLH